MEVLCAIASTCVNAETTDGRISPTLMARAGTGGNQLPIAVIKREDMEVFCAGNGQLHQMSMLPITNTLDCMNDQQIIVGRDKTLEENSERKYILRRLTPLECARLQGFPDWWCDGVDGSDSSQYRMWGNAIAIPCATDILGRIAEEIRSHG